MKESILGKLFEISLVFIGDARSRTLNKKYRDKEYVANVLTFPLGKSSGEIFINLREARRNAPDFDMGYTSFVGFLFIHALLHLKGSRHGSKMKAIERTWRKKFNL